MASNYLRSVRLFRWTRLAVVPFRQISISPVRKIVEIEEKTDGKVITVTGKQAPSDRAQRLICVPNDSKACPLCRLGLNVKFSDVLILEQFMRSDGTVLPRDVTGLCDEKQEVVERCVEQAHWSGLFPNHKPKEYNEAVEMAGYKQYKRYWASHQDTLEKKVDLRSGSWYYIRRY